MEGNIASILKGYTFPQEGREMQSPFEEVLVNTKAMTWTLMCLERHEEKMKMAIQEIARCIKARLHCKDQKAAARIKIGETTTITEEGTKEKEMLPTRKAAEPPAMTPDGKRRKGSTAVRRLPPKGGLRAED